MGESGVKRDNSTESTDESSQVKRLLSTNILFGLIEDKTLL